MPPAGRGESANMVGKSITNALELKTYIRTCEIRSGSFHGIRAAVDRSAPTLPQAARGTNKERPRAEYDPFRQRVILPQPFDQLVGNGHDHRRFHGKPAAF